MQILDTLGAAQGGKLFDNIAEVYGMEPAEVEAVAGNALPFLANAIERNTLSRGGLADIVLALGDGHHQLYLQDPRFIGSEVMVNDGNAILNHVLGSVDASRAVADKVALSSGIGAALVKQLLPILAALLMGALSKGSAGGLGEVIKRLPGGGEGLPQGGGDLGDILRRMGLPGGLPGGGQSGGGERGGGRSGRWGNETDDAGRQGGDLGDIFRRVPGLPGSRDGGASTDGGSSSLPEPSPQPPRRTSRDTAPSRNDEGDSPFDGLPGGLGDILKRLPGVRNDRSADRQPDDRRGTDPRPQPFPDQGPIGGGSPLPIPDRIPNVNDGRPSAPRDNPYGDLGDIIRKGKLPDGANVPSGGSLSDIVRDILGGNLGFKNRGIFGWILQFLIYRWGWTILKRILGGMFSGRR